jgi:signal transduction histidine kinase
MGHDEVEFEARGGALLNNWLLNRRHRATNGARSAGSRGAENVARKPGLALAVLISGTAALLLPLVAQGAAIRTPTLRPALETMLTLFCLSAAWLLRSHLLASGRLRDLLLGCAALALGLTNLFTNALPAALDVRAAALLTAAGLFGQLVVAGVFAAAATAPGHAVVSRGRHRAWMGSLLALAPLPVAALGGVLMRALGIDLSHPAGAGAHAVLFVLVLGTTGLFVYGAIGFIRENGRRPDPALALLATAGPLLAAGVMSHVVLRSLSNGEVDAGTAVRVIGAALVLCAAVALERRARARMARAAALAERRRVARDLHDGIAQDLAFIAAHSAQIATEMGEEHPVVVAARRALAVSRSTISDLSDPAGATAGEALDAVAQELRDRFDVAIAVHTQIDDHVPTGVQEHLSRIAREAIANAARHGQARNVLVSLHRAEGGIALRVLDDGRGLHSDEHEGKPEGFGLRSMRERAVAMGGSLTIRPAPRGGTELEVLLP